MFVNSSTPPEDPRLEYLRRLGALGATESNYARHDRIIGNTKLILAGLAVIIAALALGSRNISILWAIIPAFTIILLAIIHEQVIRALRKCSRVIAFYQRGLDRLDNRWIGTGEGGERFLDASHACSRDLDLFGKGSLFELLFTARTRAGEEALASWLLEPASCEEVRRRQAAVIELRSRLDLREDLAILGEDVRLGVRPDALVSWAKGKSLLSSRLMRIVLPLLASLWLFSLVAWAVWGLTYPVLLATVANLSFTYRFRERAQKVAVSAEEATRDLELLSQVLARLERETFSAPRLVELRAALETQGLAASRLIARLSRLVEALESRRHQLVKVIDPFVFWTLQLAFAVEDCRKKLGPAIRHWLVAVGEMEALSALAGYTYEHPTDVFPELTEGAPCFEAEGLAHPLIPESQAVRNDLRLGGELQLVIISGPNMAGKSTYVRAVGMNAILAQCGAPVRARRLAFRALP